MATQNSGHPPTQFTVSTPFKHVRLLELPNDLLEIITTTPSSTSNGSSSTATSQPRLKFKSAAMNSSTSTARDPGKGQNLKEPIMHLCTDDKAWAVKQVSTSNSVYLIEPTRAVSPNTKEDDFQFEDGMALTTRKAVTATAQVGNFLELHPVKIDDRAIEESIINILPIHHLAHTYDGNDMSETMDIDSDYDLTFQRENDSKPSMTLDQLINNLAVPDSIAKRICTSLAVFEIQNQNTNSTKCFIPSTRSLLQTWSKIIESCAIEGIKLDGPLNTAQILNTLSDETDMAIAHTLLSPHGTFKTLGLFNNPNTDHTDIDTDTTTSSETILNPKSTSHFIASLLITSTQTMTLSLETFLKQWTNLVPASWVKYCTSELLLSPFPALLSSSTPSASTSGPGPGPKGSLLQITPSTNVDGVRETVHYRGRIANQTLGIVFSNMLIEDFVGDISGSGSGGVGVTGTGIGIGKSVAVVGSTSTGTKNAATGDKKRKWHEKFGAQRNLKG